MRVTVLVENTTADPRLQGIHGLSLYVETRQHKLLMDVGPGTVFVENAEKLGIDLAQVDLCAVSHGHDDHGGGLGRFLQLNQKATVYLSRLAFGSYYAGKKYIGLDPELKNHPRIRLLPATVRVDSQITLLSEIPGDALLPRANGGLLCESEPDTFAHEQVMLVEEGGRLLLLGGCAHRGIVNILEHVKQVMGRYPDTVISGLHLAAGGSGVCMADDAYLDQLAQALLATGAEFYSCHCTGREALEKLQLRMPGKLHAVSTGTVLQLD